MEKGFAWEKGVAVGITDNGKAISSYDLFYGDAHTLDIFKQVVELLKKYNKENFVEFYFLSKQHHVAFANMNYEPISFLKKYGQLVSQKSISFTVKITNDVLNVKEILSEDMISTAIHEFLQARGITNSDVYVEEE